MSCCAARPVKARKIQAAAKMTAAKAKIQKKGPSLFDLHQDDQQDVVKEIVARALAAAPRPDEELAQIRAEAYEAMAAPPPTVRLDDKAIKELLKATAGLNATHAPAPDVATDEEDEDVVEREKRMKRAEAALQEVEEAERDEDEEALREEAQERHAERDRRERRERWDIFEVDDPSSPTAAAAARDDRPEVVEKKSVKQPPAAAPAKTRRVYSAQPNPAAAAATHRPDNAADTLREEVATAQSETKDLKRTVDWMRSILLDQHAGGGGDGSGAGSDIYQLVRGVDDLCAARIQAAVEQARNDALEKDMVRFQ